MASLTETELYERTIKAWDPAHLHAQDLARVGRLLAAMGEARCGRVDALHVAEVIAQVDVMLGRFAVEAGLGPGVRKRSRQNVQRELYAALVGAEKVNASMDRKVYRLAGLAGNVRAKMQILQAAEGSNVSMTVDGDDLLIEGRSMDVVICVQAWDGTTEVDPGA